MSRCEWRRPCVLYSCAEGCRAFHRNVDECLADVVFHRADSEAEVVEAHSDVYGRGVNRAIPNSRTDVVSLPCFQAIRRNGTGFVKELDVRVIPSNCQAFRHQIKLAID